MDPHPRKKYRPGVSKLQSLADEITSIDKGKFYSYISGQCVHLVPKLYHNLIEEINKRKFYTRTKASYGNIPEYYTIPINRPFIDHGPGPSSPYLRYSKNSRPKWANSDQTPELLLEPFTDDLVVSWSTMANMIDMHAKHLPFVIVRDDDVITVYKKLSYFVDSSRGLNIPEEAIDYVKYLNNMVDLVRELEYNFKVVCKKKNITFRNRSIFELLSQGSVAL